MKVTCDFCLKELTEFGGLLFSPPTPDGRVKKTHLCVRCHSVFGQLTEDRVISILVTLWSEYRDALTSNVPFEEKYAYGGTGALEDAIDRIKAAKLGTGCAYCDLGLDPDAEIDGVKFHHAPRRGNILCERRRGDI